jgi:hypothetical protein
MPADPSPYDVKSVNLELVDKPVRRGRPRTLNLRVFVAICHRIEHGFSIPNACEVEGVSYRHFRFRVSQSPRLQERVKEAEATRLDTRREQALASIMAAGERSWMAHAWFLERVWPNEFALRSVSRIDSEQDQQPEEIPAEVLQQHHRLMLELAEADRQKQALDQVPEPALNVEQSAEGA